jgi:hypothetical protein
LRVGISLKGWGYTKTNIFRVSKTIRVPIAFVYSWCTDYRETDPKITGSKSKRRILLKTKQRAIYVSTYTSGGQPRSTVNVVTLHPPRSWHLDGIGDEIDANVDYVLTKLGRRKTRLDIAAAVHYKTHEVATKAQDAKEDSEVWDKYVAALEKEYGK